MVQSHSIKINLVDGSIAAIHHDTFRTIGQPTKFVTLVAAIYIMPTDTAIYTSLEQLNRLNGITLVKKLKYAPYKFKVVKQQITYPAITLILEVKKTYRIKNQSFFTPLRAMVQDMKNYLNQIIGMLENMATVGLLTYQELMNFIRFRQIPTKYYVILVQKDLIFKFFRFRNATPLLSSLIEFNKIPLGIVDVTVGYHPHEPTHRIGWTKPFERGFLVAGSDRKALVGLSQGILTQLLSHYSRIVIFDFHNEFNALNALPNTKTFRIGTNLHLDFLSIPTPPQLEEQEKLAYKSRFLASLLLHGLEDEYSRLFHPLYAQIYQYLQDAGAKVSLLDLFSYVSQIGQTVSDLNDSLLFERLRFVIETWAPYKELNYRNYQSHFREHLLQEGLLIFQFEREHTLTVRRAIILFLMHWYYFQSMSPTLFVFSDTEQSFPYISKRFWPQMHRFYTETSFLYLRLLLSKQHQVYFIATSLSRIENQLFEHIGHFAYLKFNEHEDRQLVSEVHHLYTFSQNTKKGISEYLKTLENKNYALVIRPQEPNRPYVCKYEITIPVDLSLTPLNPVRLRKDILHGLSTDLFVITMNVLKFLQTGSATLLNLMDFLETKAEIDSSSVTAVIRELRKLPFFSQEPIQGIEYWSVTDEGLGFYREHAAQLQQLGESPTLDELLELRKQVETWEQQFPSQFSDYSQRQELFSNLVSIMEKTIAYLRDHRRGKLPYEELAEYISLKSYKGLESTDFAERFRIIMDLLDDAILLGKKLEARQQKASSESIKDNNATLVNSALRTPHTQQTFNVPEDFSHFHLILDEVAPYRNSTMLNSLLQELQNTYDPNRSLSLLDTILQAYKDNHKNLVLISDVIRRIKAAHKKDEGRS